VFDKFYQIDHSLERSESGLGLGLTLTRKLVELHGGTIVAHSAGLGMGSEFTVSLPMLPAPATRQSKEPLQSGREAAAPRWRILIVDDGPRTRQMYSMLLRQLGHEVESAADGWSGIEMVQSFRPDAVLLDVGMPGLNGFATCKEIRAQPSGKDIVLIAVTGWAQYEVQQEADEAGFDGILVKPVGVQKILEVISSLLEGKAQSAAGAVAAS
jgi:CheY-like chemotaxis protein